MPTLAALSETDTDAVFDLLPASDLGDPLKGSFQELNHALHASLNKIYSNVRQITRHQGAQGPGMDSVRRIEFLMNVPCEEIYLLTSH